jgi:hypothetical protein
VNYVSKSKIFSTGAAVVAALAVTPVTVFAQNTVDLNLPSNSAFASVAAWTPTRLVGALINLVLVLAGLVAFFYLLLGGLQWILAGGDKEGTEKARKRITAALIGLVIVFSAYAIIILASNFLGVQLLNFTITNV